MKLPYVTLKSAVSIDGFIDDSSAQRLLLSNREDFDRADEERARADAILVGAGTIRLDDPSLLVKSVQRQLDRLERGLPRHPSKITLTQSGNIPATSKFLNSGDNEKLIYCAGEHAIALSKRLEAVSLAKAVALTELDLSAVLADLAKRGIKKLLVEGGTGIATSLLEDDFVDELQISLAPFFVGDEKAPRFVNAALFPCGPKRPMNLVGVEQLGNVVLLTYRLR